MTTSKDDNTYVQLNALNHDKTIKTRQWLQNRYRFSIFALKEPVAKISVSR